MRQSLLNFYTVQIHKLAHNDWTLWKHSCTNDKVYVHASASFECLNDGINIQKLANMNTTNITSATKFFQNKFNTFNYF